MNYKNNLFFLFFAFMLSATSCSLFGSHNFSRKQVSYETKDKFQLKADLFSPKNKTVGLKPLVIVIHGGGWSARTGDMESICEKIADQGFLALNITYRFAPKFHYPVQLNDVKAVAQWVSQNAEQYEIDKSKVYVWGYSAGAHLAFLLGSQSDLEIPIHGIVVGGIPSYFPGYPKSPLITDFIGKKFEEDPKTWNEASPLALVSAKTPPVFIYHGEDDNLVGIDQAEMLDRKLADEKVQHEFFIVKHLGHISTYFFGDEAEKKGINFLKNLKSSTP